MKNVRFVCLFSYFVCVIVCMQCSAQTTAAARTRQTIDGGGAEGASLSSNALPAAIQRPQFAKPVAYYGVTPCDGWPANPESVAIGDLRGNGKNDLVVGGYCDLDVLLGNGDGTFQTAVTYGSGGSGGNEPVIGDVNGDGIPDLVVANQCQSGTESNCSASGEIGVLLGNGDGTFQPAVGYSSGGGPANAVAIADVNGDGFPDLVVANGCIEANCENGGTSVLLGNGDGTFQAPVSYLLVGAIFHFRWQSQT